jgi:hypothetical protein
MPGLVLVLFGVAVGLIGESGGQPPELTETLPGCVFAPRCAHAEPSCLSAPMELLPLVEGHACACAIRPFRESTLKQGVQ